MMALSLALAGSVTRRVYRRRSCQPAGSRTRLERGFPWTCLRRIFGRNRVLGLGVILVLAACGSPAPSPLPTVVAPPLLPGSCGLGSFEDDEAAIAALIQAEGGLVVAQEIAGLMALWDASGAVVDAAHTPDDPADDQRWDGVDALRHRYVWMVFPGAPAQAAPGQMAVEIDGDTATVTATTQIGDEVSPGGDRWDSVRTPAGCWVIRQLTFNLEQ